MKTCCKASYTTKTWVVLSTTEEPKLAATAVITADDNNTLTADLTTGC